MRADGIPTSRMERALFVHERLMLAGGKPHTVILAARCSGALSTGAVREALDWLQDRHAALRAAVILRDERPQFITPRPMPPIPVRVVARRDDESWFDELQSEFDVPLPRADGPLARLVWLRADSRNEFILITDHVICDGQSVLILMRDLIGRLLDPKTEPSPPPFFDRLDQLFTPPAGPGGRVALRGVAAIGAVALWVSSKLSLWRRRPAPAPSYLMRWEMDETSMIALTERARREQATAYAALATALLRAFLFVRPDGFNRLICPVDLRPFFAFRASRLVFPIPSHMSLSVDRSLDRSFWEQARRLKSDLLTGYVRMRPDRMVFAAERLHGLVDLVVDAALHGRRRSDINFSHLGEASLPGGTGRDAEAIALAGSVPWADPTSVISLSARGLHLCLTSREGLLPQADAERIRDHAMALIRSAYSDPQPEEEHAGQGGAARH